jgi:carboxymethylenebutenolidase
MAETVSFKSNGDTASGYLALPAGGSGPGVIVVQEWWGVNPQIKGMADRLAADGFVALVPDLYHGELAQHDEMDKASHLMQTLPMDRAARDMLGAVDYLLSRDECTSDKVGAIGFCMGGMLSLVLGAIGGDKIGAITPFYGAPIGDGGPDWTGLTAPVKGHFAEIEQFFVPDAVTALEAELKGMGKDVEFVIHAGAGHAFCNEENPLGTYNPDLANECLSDAFAFLHKNL